MEQHIPIRRAILSVTNKTNLAPLAAALKQHGCELFASSGTARYLQEHSIPTTSISQLSQQGEHFNGRMKTLSFPVASGILYDRHRDQHEADHLGIAPIDLVVSNFYDFESHQNESLPIEAIDVGGPTMIRAAAKNYPWTTALVNPNQYQDFIDEWLALGGTISQATRRRLMGEAFQYTAAYDAMIARHLCADHPAPVTYYEQKALPYGENPHQVATICATKKALSKPWRQVTGKAIGWNNLLDLEAGILTLLDLHQPSVAVIKHTVPCGVATAPTTAQALTQAWDSDPLSAFGSVVICNQPIHSLADLTALGWNHHNVERKFVDVLAAPSFSPDVIAFAQNHSRTRLLAFDASLLQQPMPQGRLLFGQYLLQQSPDTCAPLQSPFYQMLPESIRTAVAFGESVVRALKSNAVAIVRYHAATQGLQLVGMGCGQPNRVQATRLAVEHAYQFAKRHQVDREEIATSWIVISDGFFPFADSVDMIAPLGVHWIVQPGGSRRDAEVIEAAKRCGINMVMTGHRHFRH